MRRQLQFYSKLNNQYQREKYLVQSNNTPKREHALAATEVKRAVLKKAALTLSSNACYQAFASVTSHTHPSSYRIPRQTFPYDLINFTTIF